MRIINHGYRGSAFPDPATVILLGMEAEWDILCIEIGTDTYGQGYESAVELTKLYRMFLDIVRLYKPEAPVVCIFPIWRGDADGNRKRNGRGDSLQDYRNAIHCTVLELNTVDKNIYLIDGLTLICDRNGLSANLIHPDDHDMEIIADGISLKIKSII